MSRFSDQAVESSLGPWFFVMLADMPLVGSRTVFENDAAAWVSRTDPDVAEALATCPVCNDADTTSLTDAVTVFIDNRTINDKKITKRTLASCWVGNPHGVPALVMHRALAEALGADLDDRWLLGEVRDPDGALVDDLISAVDREPLRQYGAASSRTRRRYRSNWAKYFGSVSVGACAHCGRLSESIGYETYLLESEVADYGTVRAAGCGLYVAKSIVDRLELYSPAVWPNLRITRVPVYTDVLDPFPVPKPMRWEDFERHEASMGNTLPFPMIHGKKGVKPVWQKRYAADREARGLDTTPPRTDEQRIAFFLRLRSFWEPAIGEQLAGVDDKELLRLVRHGRKHNPDAPMESWIGIERTASSRRK